MAKLGFESLLILLTSLVFLLFTFFAPFFPLFFELLFNFFFFELFPFSFPFSSLLLFSFSLPSAILLPSTSLLPCSSFCLSFAPPPLPPLLPFGPTSSLSCPFQASFRAPRPLLRAPPSGAHLPSRPPKAPLLVPTSRERRPRPSPRNPSPLALPPEGPFPGKGPSPVPRNYFPGAVFPRRPSPDLLFCLLSFHKERRGSRPIQNGRRGRMGEGRARSFFILHVFFSLPSLRLSFFLFSFFLFFVSLNQAIGI